MRRALTASAKRPILQIDRRQYLIAAHFVGILLEPRFHLRHQAFNRPVLVHLAQMRGERLARQLRRAEREIKRGGAERQQHQCNDCGRAPPPQRRADAGGTFVGGHIRRRKQTPRHFDLGGLRLGLADQAGGTVAADFGKLVTIDSDVTAAARAVPSGQRPQHGENSRRRHQREHRP